MAIASAASFKVITAVNVRSKLCLSFPLNFPLTIESAHNEGAGSTKKGRDSVGKRLGAKIYDDQVAKPGAIMVQQRGTTVRPLLNKPSVDFISMGLFVSMELKF